MTALISSCADNYHIVFVRVACNQLDHCIDVSIRPSVNISRLPLCVDHIFETVCHLPEIMISLFFNFRPWTDATLWGPDLRNILPFTLDNELYR